MRQSLRFQYKTFMWSCLYICCSLKATAGSSSALGLLTSYFTKWLHIFYSYQLHARPALSLHPYKHCCHLPFTFVVIFLSFLEVLLFGWASTLPQSNPSPAFLVVAFLLDSKWKHELVVVLTCFPRGILKFFVCALDAFLVTVIRYPTKDNTMGIYSVYSSGNVVHHGGGDRSGLVCGAH